jgi:PAS domain S-box-containing protein
MEDKDKSREQLLEELAEARKRLSALQRSDAELQRTQEALTMGVDALRIILENSNELIVVLSADGKIAFVSPSLERVGGYKSAELIGTDAFDFIHPDDADAFKDIFSGGIDAPGRVINVELRFRHADGSWHDVEAEGINLLKNPAISGMVFTARDISERKRMQEALEESEGYLRSLVENTLDVVTVIDGDGTIRYLSPSLQHAFGYSPDEFIGKEPQKFLQLIHPDDAQKLADFIASSLEMPGISGPLEFRAIHKDGTERVVETIANNLLDDPAIRGSVHTFHDVTERKKADEVLRRRESYFRSLIRNATDMVSILDENLNFVWGSTAASRATGYSAEDIYGHSFLDYVVEERLEWTKEFFTDLLREPMATRTLEGPFRHEDGSWHIHEAIVTNLLDDPAVRGIVINSRDITERKLMEEQLLASNRELDAFATTVSHDLRTPLSLIEGYAQLMRAESIPDEEKEAYLKSIIAAARRMDELTESLLEYARAGEAAGEAATVEPLDVVSDILFEHSDNIEKKSIDVVLGEEFHPIKVDPLKLHQVLTNLVNNAVKFVSDSPRPHIEIASEKNAGLVTIYVRDNGIGLESGQKDEIFMPFRRLGPSGSPGTGLGLSTVKRAVESWGGMVWVESEPGEGATFFFTAPAA